MRHTFILVIGLIILLDSCNKSEFLDAKPDNSRIVPSTLEDFQHLLQNDNIFTGTSNGTVPSLTMLGADETLFEPVFLQYYTPQYINQYTWQQDPFLGATSLDWNAPYNVIYYANIILEGLKKIGLPADQQQYNSIKGAALFHRAFMYYSLAQVFAPHYNTVTAASDPGLPLRIRADISEKISRSTVKDTYDLLLGDLREAATLLPEEITDKILPSKPAAYGLLSRVYQTLGNIDSALYYASESLDIYDDLMNFNDLQLNSNGQFMIPRFNQEVLFHTKLGRGFPPGLSSIDSTIRNSYEDNDLRKQVFIFKNSNNVFFFIGSYNSDYAPFAGLATDEIYLIRAECYARKGDIPEAMEDLNTLLVNRYVTGTFTPLNAATAEEALQLILAERRKELVYRGVRWTDLRRLNAEGANITLTREFQGQTYTLPPNTARWTWPIPPDVISFNPDMPQNPR